jgi:hypothetical protein
MVSKTHKQLTSPWAIAVIICVIAAVVLVAALLLKPAKEVNSFQSCKAAGGSLLESYPEQCLINGKTFTNPDQSLENNTEAYIGLAEQQALDMASQANKTARVVERNGESLPVTMDFMPGRLNLYVKEGKVYKVQVEGQENQ